MDCNTLFLPVWACIDYKSSILCNQYLHTHLSIPILYSEAVLKCWPVCGTHQMREIQQLLALLWYHHLELSFPVSLNCLTVSSSFKTHLFNSFNIAMVLFIYICVCCVVDCHFSLLSKVHWACLYVKCTLQIQLLLLNQRSNQHLSLVCYQKTYFVNTIHFGNNYCLHLLLSIHDCLWTYL